MATPDQHIQQWRHNRAFLGTIQPSYPDWAITAAFYAALHAVSALLAHDQTGRVTSHESRNGILAGNKRYQKIWKHYQPLYSLCRTIRYQANPTQWVPWEQIDKQVIRNYLYPVENSVLKLMQQDLNLPTIQLALPTSGDAPAVPDSEAAE